MGRISGKTGPDALEDIEREYGSRESYDDAIREEGDAKGSVLYGFSPTEFRITEFDQDGHTALETIERTLNELGVSLTRLTLPTADSNPDERKYVKWDFRKTTANDVLYVINITPGQTADFYARKLFGGDHWSPERLQRAIAKFRTYVTRLKASNFVKLGYDDMGKTVYFLTNHATESPLSRGGQIQPPPVTALTEERVTDVANYLKLSVNMMGLDTETVEQTNPLFFRDLVKAIAHKLEPTNTNNF